MPRNRPWSREELVLALDLYFKIGASYKTHPDVIELSEVLNRLSDSSGESDATRFRNPSGVAMKLGNFARLDRNYSGAGLTHGNKLETIEVELPAVITTDLRLNEPRYVKLPDIMKAKKKPLDEIALAELGITAGPQLVETSFEPPSERQKGIMVDDVAGLIAALKDKGIL